MTRHRGHSSSRSRHSGFSQARHCFQGHYAASRERPAVQRTIDIFADRYRARRLIRFWASNRAALLSEPPWLMSWAPAFLSCASRANYPYQTHSASYALEYGTRYARDPYRCDSAAGPRGYCRRSDCHRGHRRGDGPIGFHARWTVVECAFVIELSFLKGREKLKPHGVFSHTPLRF